MEIRRKGSATIREAKSKEKSILQGQNGCKQISTRYDPEMRAIWCWMHPDPRPCMTSALVDELTGLQKQLGDVYSTQQPDADTIWMFRHFIFASKTPGIFSLGGDLALFKQCIINKDEVRLRDYAYKCTKLVYSNITKLDLPVTTYSLVQGQALGGGFETALSCDVIVAERSSQMGFPEIMFNLFPGMGAYNLLARRIGASLAERLILSGKTYSATELYDMGVVDVLAEDGEGVQAVESYLKSHNQSHNTIRAMKQIRQIVHPITQQNLYDIVDIWVAAALDFSDKDLAKMDRLLQLQQDSKSSDIVLKKDAERIKRRGDWRKVQLINFPLVTHLGENVVKNRRKTVCRRQA